MGSCSGTAPTNQGYGTSTYTAVVANSGQNDAKVTFTVATAALAAGTTYHHNQYRHGNKALQLLLRQRTWPPTLSVLRLLLLATLQGLHSLAHRWWSATALQGPPALLY